MQDIPIWNLTYLDKLCEDWKHCSWCQQRLPRSAKFYHRDRNQKDGLKFRCKHCTRILAEVGKAELPRMTASEHKLINDQQDRDRLKGRIKIAAQTATNAATGIILDGRRLTIPIKVCAVCQHQLPATTDYFTRCKQSKKDGLSNKCKQCVNKPRRKRRQANKNRKPLDIG